MVVLAGLMGLTSWVVASVSTWLVPVYVTAMVLIFVIPRAQHPEDAERDGDNRALDVGEDGAARASGPASSSPDPTDAVIPLASGSAQASASTTDLSNSTAAKPRRARARARKPAKAGAEAAVAPAPATWIRVGPGKFVRADSQDQVASTAEGSPQDSTSEATVPETETVAATITEPVLADVPVQVDLPEPGLSSDIPAPSEEPVTVADPQPDSPVTALAPEADEAREESNPLALPEASVLDQVSPDDPLVPEPATEEYGIAPSAFGPDLPTDASEIGDPGSSPVVSGAGSISLPIWIGPDGESSSCGIAGSRYAEVQIEPRSRLHRVSSGIPGAGVSRLRRNVRSGRSRRDFSNLGCAVNLRLRTQSRRNLGRFAHIHRGFLPRSPPERS
jgi:hypothetical protein